MRLEVASFTVFFFAFRRSFQKSKYSFLCPISRDSVLSRCEYVFDCVARVQLSVYPNFSSDSIGGRSLMYTLKNVDTSTDPWGRPSSGYAFD